MRSIFRFLNPYKADPPATIYLAVNGKCNLHCSMCDVGQKQIHTQFYRNSVHDSELSLDVLKGFVKEVSVFKPIIAITSLEPLLYKNLVPLVSLIKSYGMKTQVTTNGFLLPYFAKSLSEADLDVLCVSLDGPKDVHNEIRGNPQSYDRIMEGLDILRKMKEYGKKIPEIWINCTISDKNYNKFVPLFFDMLRDNDLVSTYYFSFPNFVTKGVSDQHNIEIGDKVLSTESCVSGSDFSSMDFKSLATNTGVIQLHYINLMMRNPERKIKIIFSPSTQFSYDNYFNHPETFLPGCEKCGIPWRAAQVFANGELGISTRCYNFTYGNINDGVKFLDRWNGKEMKAFRKILLDNGGALPACSRCCGVM